MSDQYKKTKIILSIIGISFVQGLQFSISPVLSQIQLYYPEVNISLIQMLITAPTLLSMVMSIAVGSLVVRISKKKLLLVGCFITGITGFIPIASDSFILLFLSRTVYGIGLGIATTLNVAVVAEFFKGKERVVVMGIQAASVGAGMVIITVASGLLGTKGFQYAYFIHIIGFIAMFLIAACLPDTGIQKTNQHEPIKLNKTVVAIAAVGFMEFLFLITFSTNLSMHLSGSLAGSTSVSGNLTGVFSGAQILVGLILGLITNKYTIPTAMFSFTIGAVFLILFPSQAGLLMVGAMFCGFSQGLFVPTAMVILSNSVTPTATAMATACFNVAVCLGQLLSPAVLNTVSKSIFGEVTTSNVYMVSSIGMMITALIAVIVISKNRTVQ